MLTPGISFLSGLHPTFNSGSVVGSHTGFQVTYMWNMWNFQVIYMWNATSWYVEQWCGTQLHLPSFSSDPHSSFTSLVSFLCFSFSGFFLHLLFWLHPTTSIWSPFQQEHDLLEAFPWIRCQLKRRLWPSSSTPTMAPVPRQHMSPSRHVRHCQAIVRPGQSWLQARLGFMWENSSLAAFSSIDCHHWSFNSCLLLSNQPFTLKSLAVRKNSAVLDNCTSLQEAFEWESSSPWLQFFMLMTTVKTCMQGKGWLWVLCVNSQVSLRSNGTMPQQWQPDIQGKLDV